MPAITGRGSGCGPASGNRPSTNPRGRARRYGDLKILVLRCRGRGACNLTLSYYKAQFSRLCAKHGAKKAFCAVAASMLTAIYHMLKDGVEHKDLGVSYFDKRSTDIKAKRLVAQLTKLGFQVNLQPIKEAA